MPAADEPRHWGSFTLGGAAYALPLAQLREAVPAGRLAVWPGTSGCVPGAVELRGLLLPVVDLRRLGGAPPKADADADVHAKADVHANAVPPLVIVIAHDGHLLGLCADAVTGIFQAAGDGLQTVTHADGSEPCVLGALARPDSGALHSVLNAAALMALPQVPRCRDPRATGPLDPASGAAVPAPDEHWLLMQAGPWRLAIASSCVRMAVPLQGLRPSVLSRMRGNDDCLGEWPHPTQPIAVIDPLARAGLGRLAEGEARQALLLDTDGGLLGLAIDRVLDVRHLPPQALQPLPGGRVTRPEWFAGVLRLPEDGGDQASGLDAEPSPLLVLDAARWTGHDELAGMASLHAPGATATASSDAGSGALTLITYALPAEAGTPIDQVDEVLPWQCDREGVEDDGVSPWVGLCMHRQQPVSLLCLRRWSGAATSPTTDSAASILLVRSGEQRIGFIVPKLLGIEQAGWQPAVAGVLRSRNPTPIQAARLAQVDPPTGPRRLVPVLDLRDIARKALASRAPGTPL
ncbi:chemotaxis protein CheW [Leptothrix sp. BB-4]